MTLARHGGNVVNAAPRPWPFLLLAFVIEVWAMACAAATPGPGASPYRAPSDTIAVPDTSAEAIYTTALRFYQPPHGQARWLDRHRLPATLGDSAAGLLDSSLAVRLVANLGRGFCLLDAPDACESRQGVELRVSEIYAAEPRRARVVVAARLIVFGSGAINIGSQAFTLARSDDGWRIAERHGVGSTP
ncbi:MAG: hypothetical protein ACRENS_11945 [Candidatus Eiseniibacteriota bacterium]